MLSKKLIFTYFYIKGSRKYERKNFQSFTKKKKVGVIYLITHVRSVYSYILVNNEYADGQEMTFYDHVSQHKFKTAVGNNANNLPPLL